MMLISHCYIFTQYLVHILCGQNGVQLKARMPSLLRVTLSMSTFNKLSKLFRSHFSFSSPMGNSSSLSAGDETAGKSNMPHYPSTSDILSVKDVLMKRLPIEVVDAIIDLAEYWPHTTVTWSLSENLDSHPFPAQNRNENELVVSKLQIEFKL